MIRIREHSQDKLNKGKVTQMPDNHIICDIILPEIKERFSFNDHLFFVQLFDFNRFVEYRHTFLDKLVASVKCSFPMINILKLKSELVPVIVMKNYNSNSNSYYYC